VLSFAFKHSCHTPVDQIQEEHSWHTPVDQVKEEHSCHTPVDQVQEEPLSARNHKDQAVMKMNGYAYNHCLDMKGENYESTIKNSMKADQR
jgi:hypothetical protein